MLEIASLILYVFSVYISYKVATSICVKKGHSGIDALDVRWLIFPPTVVAIAYFRSKTAEKLQEELNEESHRLALRKKQKLKNFVKYSSGSNHGNGLCESCKYFKKQFSTCQKLQFGVTGHVESCSVYQENCV